MCQNTIWICLFESTFQDFSQQRINKYMHSWAQCFMNLGVLFFWDFFLYPDYHSKLIFWSAKIKCYFLKNCFWSCHCILAFICCSIHHFLVFPTIYYISGSLKKTPFHLQNSTYRFLIKRGVVRLICYCGLSRNPLVN